MKNNKILTIFAIVAAIFCISMCSKTVEKVALEDIVVNQNRFPFNGSIQYWTTPGIKGQWWGELTRYSKAEQFWFGGSDLEGDAHGTPIKVRFRDGSEGTIYGSFRITLPTNEQNLAAIQETYGSMEGLMNNLVVTAAKNAIYTTGSLMTAFESYAEKKGELRSYIEDQLQNGLYKTAVQEIETTDAVTGEKKLTSIATLVKGANGDYLRDGVSPFAKYGILADQVSITDVVYEQKVVDQISEQQKANMRIQTAKAEAAAAQQDAIKAEEKGKADAAQARWEQEKIKATEVTKAEQEREVAKLAAEKAEFDKKRIIAEGQAEAEANRLKVQAGLTPQERAEWDYKTTVGVAQALAGSNVKWVPDVMFGGNSSSGNSAMDAVGLNMVLDIAKKMNQK